MDTLTQVAQAAVVGEIDWVSIIAAGARQYGTIMRFGDKLYTFDFASIYQRYADTMGVDLDGLTDFQKRQALFNAVLEQA